MRSTTIEFVEIFFTKERKKKQPCLSRGKIEQVITVLNKMGLKIGSRKRSVITFRSKIQEMLMLPRVGYFERRKKKLPTKFIWTRSRQDDVHSQTLETFNKFSLLNFSSWIFSRGVVEPIHEIKVNIFSTIFLIIFPPFTGSQFRFRLSTRNDTASGETE